MSFALRIMIKQAPFSRWNQSRLFSSHEAVQKLKQIFQEYRKENYSQELPSRFRKDVIRAADKNKDGLIEFDEMMQLLNDIGATDRLSKSELDAILLEAGATGSKKGISVEKMAEIL